MQRYSSLCCHVFPLLFAARTKRGLAWCVTGLCTNQQSTCVQIAEWREEGKAEIVPGVLFIDEASSRV
jgi:DNA helicase TIP49 (TBP-interacting protein)